MISYLSFIRENSTHLSADQALAQAIKYANRYTAIMERLLTFMCKRVELDSWWNDQKLLLRQALLALIRSWLWITPLGGTSLYS